MRAIILAAGEGKRLRPLTNEQPKCLIELEGKSILDRQVEIMKHCGIDEISVVKGYRADAITREDVRHYVNSAYDTTNMIMTLWSAEKELTGDFIVSYGDIIYNEEVLRKLIDSPHDIAVIVDGDWQKYWEKRFEDPLSDAEALKMKDGGRIEVIGQKAHCMEDVEAGYIGLCKFQGDGVRGFRESFEHARKIAGQGGAPWGSKRSLEMSYMTDMLQGLVNEGREVHGVVVRGGWLEIDSITDYEVAKEMFDNGRVAQL